VPRRKEQRYRCSTCGRTFAATTGTPFYRQRTVAEVVTLVLTLLCHGCPLQAIVAAFGFDERTVRAWQARVGEHCQEVHTYLVQQGQRLSLLVGSVLRRGFSPASSDLAFIELPP
jgi:transposase-like protein